MFQNSTFASVAALTLALTLALVARQPVRAEDPHHEAYAACAKACAECALHCSACFRHCADLVVDGKKDHARSMYLCNDCGAFCELAAQIVGRGGPLSWTVCDGCAKACDTCAESCEKFPDDHHMKACAKSCRDCAKACRDMMKHAAK